MSNRNALNARFHALLKQAGALANKSDILSGFGVESTKELSDEQLAKICDSLAAIAEKKNPAPEIRRKRSRVLYLCQDLGVFNGKNWDRLNAFLQQPRIAGKMLYECSADELDALNRKLTIMLKSRTKAIENENDKATWN